MGLAFIDYTLPAVNGSFLFTTSTTQTTSVTSLGFTMPVPTTTGGWFALPLVRLNTSYQMATGSGYVDQWTWITSFDLYGSAGSSVRSWQATYMRTYALGDLQTNPGIAITYTTGITGLALSVVGVRAGSAGPQNVTVSSVAGVMRVFYQTASGTTPGCEAYKDQNIALPAVVSAGADGLAIQRLRYRISQATSSSGKFHGLPIGSTIKRYS